ncbi:MAG: hypothetical protein VX644_06690, partial [Planctomycetota bacterium]|nr:hypothetical protein [Planctomycetota bacterium]
NGDTLGTPANWFRGVIGQQKARGANQLDGLRANQFHIIASDEEKKLSVEQRKQRNDLERQLTELREKKTELADQEYFQSLETICLELARLYQQVETTPGKGS